MTEPRGKQWVSLLSLLTAAVLVVWFAPAERTLGQGIKVVYVHVSLTWAGMLGFTVAGLLGLALVVTRNPDLQRWNRVISRVALLWFAAGFIMSLAAARVNWGAIYWQEPRVLASVRFLVAAALVQFVTRSGTSPRISGILSAFLALFLMWSILGTPRVLHPGSPIRTSSSKAIQLTFIILPTLSTLVAAWIVRFWHKKTFAQN